MGANGIDKAKKRHHGRTKAPYAPAFRQEAIALVRRAAGGGVSLASVARDLAVSQDTLRAWVRQAEIDGGRREGLTTDERAELTQHCSQGREPVSLAGPAWLRTPAWWTFVDEDGVEPTNTAAERAIRPAVVWRKGSYGTQSDGGARFVERRLTVTATCRQQGRAVLDSLTTVCTAAQLGHPIPALLSRPV
jgi:transposase-like protein